MICYTLKLKKIAQFKTFFLKLGDRVESSKSAHHAERATSRMSRVESSSSPHHAERQNTYREAQTSPAGGARPRISLKESFSESSKTPATL